MTLIEFVWTVFNIISLRQGSCNSARRTRLWMKRNGKVSLTVNLRLLRLAFLSPKPYPSSTFLQRVTCLKFDLVFSALYRSDTITSQSQIVFHEYQGCELRFIADQSMNDKSPGLRLWNPLSKSMQSLDMMHIPDLYAEILVRLSK